jgi:hypothetical protein
MEVKSCKFVNTFTHKTVLFILQSPNILIEFGPSLLILSQRIKQGFECLQDTNDPRNLNFNHWYIQVKELIIMQANPNLVVFDKKWV